MDSLFDLAAPAGEDAEVAEAVGEALGFALPEACVPGVAANVRLLRRHLAVLEEGR